MKLLVLLVMAVPVIGYGFDLVNKSGHDFVKVWLAKHKTNFWGSSLVKEPLKNGTGIELPSPNYTYDLRIQYSTKDYQIWEDFDSKVARITVTILPDKKWQAHYE